MLKFKTVLASIILIIGNGLISSQAYALDTTMPTLVSFKMSPDEVDNSISNPRVTFDLIVNNETGIYSTNLQVKLSDGNSNSLLAPLTRTDNPINLKLKTVEFKGDLLIPANFPSGVYFATASPIIGSNSSETQGYSTEQFAATSSAKLVGAEDGILIRNLGNLGFNYATFVGPSFNKSNSQTYKNRNYYSQANPIWKVGEKFEPNKYYELRVPNLALKVRTSTPNVCISDGFSIRLISTGICDFEVYTDPTKDYLSKSDSQSVQITSARIKPTYFIDKVADQTSKNLPKAIPLPMVYGPFGYLAPLTKTPSVCTASGFMANLISGGICTIIYSSDGNDEYLPSDKYELTFEITRDVQSLNFTLQKSISLSVKHISLSASSTAGLNIGFESLTPKVCTINNQNLILDKSGICIVKAVQIGSTTIAPAEIEQRITVLPSSTTIKKILCIKSGKTKYFLSKKCPFGYQQKR